jgi:hypothetical protein
MGIARSLCGILAVWFFIGSYQVNADPVLSMVLSMVGGLLGGFAWYRD